MHIQPYLFFEGRCEEALDFYKQAIDAQVEFLMRYDDNPSPPQQSMIPSGNGRKIMHAEARVGDTSILASDGMCTGNADFQGFSLTLTVANEAEARRRFEALAEGGKVTMPLAESFFSPSFGMLVDRFGVNWMVIVPQPM